MTSDVETSGVWFGQSEAQAFGWLSHPVGEIGRSGVLMLPPVGYPYWTAHRTLRVLAERLVESGHTVLRLDYAGTGDAPGDQWEADRLAAWQASVHAAAAQLRSLGVTELSLVGARLGGSLALTLGDELNASRVAAWSPVIRGRRYVKEIKLLSIEVPVEFDLHGDGTRALSGFVFSAETVQSLSGIDLSGLVTCPADQVLLVDATPAAGPIADTLRELGAKVLVNPSPGAETAFDTPTEFATVPDTIVEQIVAWFGQSSTEVRVHETSTTAVMPWRGGEVRETAMGFPPQGHMAIVCEPANRAPDAGALVLLNSGSETHVGPGRAWVELARDLACRGHRVIRVDFLGWGESPDVGRAPGRPYDPAGVADANAIAVEVRGRFGGPVVLFGLCAAAWIILQSVLDQQVDGVIAMNPQMYWQQGDPADIDWDRIRRRRADEIETVAAGAHDGLWDRLDEAGERPRVARWLEAIAASGIPAQMLFAEGDDGLIYLSQRFRRRLEHLQAKGGIQLAEILGVDHPLHRVWARQAAFDAIATAYEFQRDSAQARA